MACLDNKNPLQGGGTSQDQRVLPALKEGYVSIDERNYADWIVFANEYAAYLNYFGTENEVAGNWKPFFESDISSILGGIAIQDIDEYRRAFSKPFALLKGDEFVSGIALKRETLGSLFGAIMTISKAFDEKLKALPADIGLKSSIQNLIASKLQPALYRLLSYYKAGKSINLIKEKEVPEWKILGYSVIKASERITEGLSAIWISDAENWQVYYNGIVEDQSIYGDPLWNNHRKINHLANHNLFSSLFDQFLLSYSKVILEAENSLMATLSSHNSHSPHYALFLSFLKLFRFAKQHANTLTKRHLDFYYNEVLQLFPKRPVENKTHIIVELSKQTEAFLLKKGSFFKAGKDSLGKELSYVMDQDTVFNKGKVAALMCLYKGNANDNISPINNSGRLFASLVANSADGLGAPSNSVNKEWHPYLHKTYADGVLKSLDMPKATIGLAVASHYLYLSEGERTVNVKFAAAFSALQRSALSRFDCYLTVEKGWLKVPGSSWSTGQISQTTNPAAVLTFTLSGDMPAITNYNVAVHGGTYDTSVPMLRLLLRNEDTHPYVYDTLKDIVISKAEIEVRVGMNNADSITPGGLRNLILSNDIGVLDPSKPFMPFGPTPLKGNSLVVGNEEVFKKINAQIMFRVEWKGLPEEAYLIDFNGGAIDYNSKTYVDKNPKVDSFTLQQGIWQPHGTEISILSDFTYDFVSQTFSINKEVVSFPDKLDSLPQGAISEYHQPYKDYDMTAVKGFMKFTLAEGFGHQEYQTAFTKYLISLANGGNPSAPAEPYTPTIQKLTLHYKASSIAELSNSGAYDSRGIQFFHIYPFGEMEQHRKLTGKDVKFLPQFTDAGNTSLHNEGEFYIGLTGLVGGQSVNILFQVLEGSTDPLLDKPERHISWSYLKNNQWQSFESDYINDQTSQLIKTGIISFVLPADANTKNTMLPEGYIWLRAAVREKATAVCKLIAVLAQAAVTTFQDQNNAPEFLEKALPAGAISKLKAPIGSIKKIEQPYASFGGRAKESNDAYYVRVSERLRHKSRSITIWDYERLVLEAFPQIHRVKCLNHTQFEGAEYNEVAPGHVTIITIPKLENGNDANPLRPYTNQDVLTSIYEFLKSKASPHVKLHVRQPQFEEVRLEFKVKFYTGLEFNFYRELLQKELTEHLTPWAYADAGNVSFGGQVHKSVIINFIEERAYVDFITEVKMYHRIGENGSLEGADTDLVRASTGKSILVSAAKEKHSISEIVDSSVELRREVCIDRHNQGLSGLLEIDH